jgi:oligopeptide transport system permease protein
VIHYVLRRLFGIIPTLIIIITLSFFIIRLAPGSPFSSERNLPPAVIANLEKKIHLDEPLILQYLRYLGDVLRGDLGYSTKHTDFTINEFIVRSLPVSLTLGVAALTLALVTGVTFGVMAALRRNTLLDHGLMALSILGISVPMFVIGPLLQLFFSVYLGWLPTAGWISSRSGGLTLILPILTLSVTDFAYIARLTRTSVLEILRSDFIRTARAKGLPERDIIFKHTLRGALLPVLSFLGPAFANIVTGSVVVESIFDIPGMGRFFVNSALNRDYFMIMATVIVYAVILLVANLVVDIIYAIMDPRVVYE